MAIGLAVFLIKDKALTSNPYIAGIAIGVSYKRSLDLKRRRGRRRRRRRRCWWWAVQGAEKDEQGRDGEGGRRRGGRKDRETKKGTVFERDQERWSD
eukprot:764632-Hanusia_phi.AAC.4